MDKVFISYRREDTEGFARGLFQSLVGSFGKDQIFMDVEAISLGVDFIEAIDKNLADCGAFVVLIGKQWLDCTEPDGSRRLDNPNDFVRIEVAKAIQRDVRVIPVLVKGASLPKAEELPEDLRPLTRRQALELSHERWDRDVEHLASSIETILGLKRVDKIGGSGKQPTASFTEHTNSKPKSRKTFRNLAILFGAMIIGGLFVYNSIMESIQPVYNPPVYNPAAPGQPGQQVQSQVPPVTPTSSQMSPRNLSGIWFDQEGVRVEVAQNGSTVISQSIDPSSGAFVQSQWQLNGRNFEFFWTATSGNNGYGKGVIAADYNSIQFQFVDNLTGLQEAGYLTRATR